MAELRVTGHTWCSEEEEEEISFSETQSVHTLYRYKFVMFS